MLENIFSNWPPLYDLFNEAELRVLPPWWPGMFKVIHTSTSLYSPHHEARAVGKRNDWHWPSCNRPHMKYGGRYCFHRCVSFTMSTGQVSFLRGFSFLSSYLRGVSGQSGMGFCLVRGWCRQIPSSWDGYCHGRYASHWNVFLLNAVITSA